MLLCMAAGDAVVATCAGDSEVRVHDVSRSSATDVYRCPHATSPVPKLHPAVPCSADCIPEHPNCTFWKQQALPYVAVVFTTMDCAGFLRVHIQHEY